MRDRRASSQRSPSAGAFAHVFRRVNAVDVRHGNTRVHANTHTHVADKTIRRCAGWLSTTTTTTTTTTERAGRPAGHYRNTVVDKSTYTHSAKAPAAPPTSAPLRSPSISHRRVERVKHPQRSAGPKSPAILSLFMRVCVCRACSGGALARVSAPG